MTGNLPLGRLGMEFLVVVLGVLVALGVDQAVEQRRADGLEQAYLEALAADVQSDLATLRTDLLPGIDDREARSRAVLAVVEGESVLDPAYLAVALDFAGHLRIFAPRRSTYDDLVATGNLRLLKDQQLRSEIVAYYAVAGLEDMHELIRNEIWYGYRPVIDEVLDPVLLAELTRLERETRGGYAEVAEAVAAELGPPELDMTTLRSSSSFRAGIASALEYTLVQRSLYIERVEHAERLLALITDSPT